MEAHKEIKLSGFFKKILSWIVAGLAVIGSAFAFFSISSSSKSKKEFKDNVKKSKDREKDIKKKIEDTKEKKKDINKKIGDLKKDLDKLKEKKDNIKVDSKKFTADKAKEADDYIRGLIKSKGGK
jgi:septal ring factor EnvC (AmiA/AmiB activator)|tara:strand:- start:1261 stop:1635 length:375 start_codon:yes stop_codon:yes gene_type:complete